MASLTPLQRGPPPRYGQDTNKQRPPTIAEFVGGRRDVAVLGQHALRCIGEVRLVHLQHAARVVFQEALEICVVLVGEPGGFAVGAAGHVVFVVGDGESNPTVVGAWHSFSWLSFLTVELTSVDWESVGEAGWMVEQNLSTMTGDV